MLDSDKWSTIQENNKQECKNFFIRIWSFFFFLFFSSFFMKYNVNKLINVNRNDGFKLQIRSNRYL